MGLDWPHLKEHIISTAHRKKEVSGEGVGCHFNKPDVTVSPCDSNSVVTENFRFVVTKKRH